MMHVAVSGGFDPLHPGHVRLFNEAKKLAGKHGKLTVILNNDNWLMKKKGFVFMSQKDRIEVLLNLRSVDEVVLTNHKKNTNDMSVCNTLLDIKPDIFANGGDRKSDNIPEYQLCKELGIKMVFNVGGEKICSSSELVKKSIKVLKMNKKAQHSPMGMNHIEGNRAHPLIYVGIFTFILPFLSGIINIKIPSWVSIIGIIFILIGAALSIYNLS